MTTKFCPQCKIHKSKNEFSRDSHQPDGLNYHCRSCRKKDRKIAYSKKHENIITVTEKFCPSCKTTKPSSDFARARKRPDGLQPHCKKCFNASARKRWLDKKGGIKQNIDSSAYQEKVCSKCGKMKPRKDFVVEKNGHINVCKMCVKEKSHKWNETLSPEKRVQLNQRSRQYRKDNPERMRMYEYKRRVLEEQAEGTFTKGDIAKMKKLQKGKCLCCGKEGKLTVDHIIPLSKGGTNNISNLQLLCHHCNIKKNAKTKDYRSKALIRKLLDVGELF